jgi:hypothetical protein
VDGEILEGAAYWSRMPSTDRPRSLVSLRIRRDSIRSESHCTNTYSPSIQERRIYCPGVYLQVVEFPQGGIQECHDTLSNDDGSTWKN